MVEKEVKKKTQAYALMGILLASMCVALIYSVGTPPSTPNLNQRTGEVSPMKTFTSVNELKTFLTTSTTQQPSYTMATGGDSNLPMPSPSQAPTEAHSLTTDSKDHSTTNIQVEGVDEADTVKTDGDFLYVLANNTIYILNADPQNAKVLSKIKYENVYLSGIYLSQDGSKLAVIGNQYVLYVYSDAKTGLPVPEIYPSWYNTETSFVYVYDVSNRNSPTLARNFTMTGNYLNSRMIGNYVYTIFTQYAYTTNDNVILPMVFSGRSASQIAPTSIYYSGVNDTSYSYTTFVAINIADQAQAPSNMTIMMGGAGEIYVSPTNIYVTYPVYEYEVVPVSTIAPTATALPTRTDNSSSSGNETSEFTVTPSIPLWRPTTTKTSIYRVHISEASMTFAAQGNVTGTILDQYSMDESGSNFRVITTAYIYDNDSFMGMEQTNVYVLDMDLNTVGKLEGIAPGENFYSSRFMSNRLYLVTFYTIDPLFVIDLTQATNPRILGNLTIPGYSGFMQPYDETHIIGIGKDANASIDADKVHTQGAIYYTAILGLKLSLFDVSDITAPKEIAKIVIGDQGTDSQALYDPHAFLLDSSKNLLVIPINLYMNQTVTAPKLGETAVPSPTANDSLIVPTPTSAPGFSEPSSYPMMVWQGVYVFKVTLTGGFEVRGNVTQLSSEQLANLAQGGYYYYGSYDNGYNYWITRSLYIGNTLYTISNARVQLNSLTDMALQATVELS